MVFREGLEEEVRTNDSLRQTHTESPGSRAIGAGHRRAARSSADRAAASARRAGGAARRHRAAAAGASGHPPGSAGERNRDAPRAPAESDGRGAAAVEPGVEQSSRRRVRRSGAIQGRVRFRRAHPAGHRHDPQGSTPPSCWPSMARRAKRFCRRSRPCAAAIA